MKNKEVDLRSSKNIIPGLLVLMLRKAGLVVIIAGSYIYIHAYLVTMQPIHTDYHI